MITLRRMSLRDCFTVIPWRNACRADLRTPTDDTRWTQFVFWLRVICNPFSRHRYRSAYQDGQLVAMVGLCHIVKGQRAEISLISNPQMRGQGIGGAVVALARDDARQLGLATIWGEVYATNTAVSFWRRLVTARNGKWKLVVTERDGQMVSAYRFEVRP